MEQGFWASNPQPGGLRKGASPSRAGSSGRPRGHVEKWLWPIGSLVFGGWDCREKGSWLPQGQACRCLGLN